MNIFLIIVGIYVASVIVNRIVLMVICGAYDDRELLNGGVTSFGWAMTLLPPLGWLVFIVWFAVNLYEKVLKNVDRFFWQLGYRLRRR